MRKSYLLNLDWLDRVEKWYRRFHRVKLKMDTRARSFFRAEWPEAIMEKARIKGSMGGASQMRICPLRTFSDFCSEVVRSGYLPPECRRNTLDSLTEELLRHGGMKAAPGLPPNWRDRLLAAIGSGDQPRLLRLLRGIYLPLLNPGRGHTRCEGCGVLCWAIFTTGKSVAGRTGDVDTAQEAPS